MMRRQVVAGAVLIAVASASGCNSDDAVCVESEVGEVCADGGDGQVKFSGSGLEPGSEVRLASGLIDPLVLTAEPDGTLDPNGLVGFMSLFADTEVTFSVAATDEQGDPLVGEITVST